VNPKECSRGRSTIAIAIVALLLGVSGCASDLQGAAPFKSESSSTVGMVKVSIGDDGADVGRLETLWQERTQSAASSDFAVGPGDVLQVTVPEMVELKDRQVRVSGDRTIELPVLGSVDVGGLTEAQVRDALKQHLRKYMKDPQVDVFVKEYQSRMVAVEGMVQKPGLYGLTSRSDTVMDVISRAGGMLENASTRVIFVPANPNGAPSTMPSATLASNSSPSMVSDADPSGSAVGPMRPDRARPVSFHEMRPTVTRFRCRRASRERRS